MCLRTSLYLTYIYYRKLFPKGDILTIGLLLGVLCYALYALYLHYESWQYALWSLPLGGFMYHNNRKDLPLLKVHSHYRAIIITEYVIENLPFLVLILLKKDFITAVAISLSFVLIGCLPQKNFTLKYPFSLADPFWHIAFRKYKLILGLPIAIALIIIGAVYQNPNLALFALALVALIGCIPYFEREFKAHMNVSAYRGKDYLLHQLKAGILNISFLFAPVFITYIICFHWQYTEVLPLYISVPTLRSSYQIRLLEQFFMANFCFVSRKYRCYLYHSSDSNPLFLPFSTTNHKKTAICSTFSLKKKVIPIN